MKKVLITALLEISDHDGYCSGEECEYESKQIVHLCNIPSFYEDYEIGNINDLIEHDWLQYLPELELNTHESYYCNLSDECEEAELEKHDYRYTILNVEIVDEI
jgi:hypothetical protein